MPKHQQIFTWEISPEHYLNNCSPDELKELDLLLSRPFYQNRMKAKTCKVCGCTDYDCRQCIEETGEPCYWVEDNLCSACAAKIPMLENN